MQLGITKEKKKQKYSCEGGYMIIEQMQCAKNATDRTQEKGKPGIDGVGR